MLGWPYEQTGAKPDNPQGCKTLHPLNTEAPIYEAEVAEGLEDIAQAEIQNILGHDATIHTQKRGGAVRFSYTDDVQALEQFKTVIAVYRSLLFDVPRPKALLGHQHFHQLSQHIRQIVQAHPQGAFHTLSINAAGSDSSVMRRLKDELAAQLALQVTEDTGDLLLRVRRPRTSKQERTQGKGNNAGWEILLRLTPRPLATRHWRVGNMQGALNAGVARAMLHLLQPEAGATMLNMACGSGTLLIERHHMQPDSHSIGCDINAHALSIAQANINAAASTQSTSLLRADAQALPLPTNSLRYLCADLPFGQLVGSHAENVTLYPAILHEAARVAAINARFALITHEVKLMSHILHAQNAWITEHERIITLTGLHPRIFVLKRQATPV